MYCLVAIAHNVTDRRRQTEDIMMPIADHTIGWKSIGN